MRCESGRHPVASVSRRMFLRRGRVLRERAVDPCRCFHADHLRRPALLCTGFYKRIALRSIQIAPSRRCRTRAERRISGQMRLIFEPSSVRLYMSPL